MSYRIGVDVGGSFTDFAVLAEDEATLHTLKVFSRPDDPGAEIVKGLEQISELYGVRPEEVSYFTHGTTVGVNTVIQRNGHRLALFTTRNFEDVLELARLKMPNFHNLNALRPTPLISRDCVFGIEERIDSQGRVLQPVSEASVQAAVAAAQAAGVEGIVVSFLHSYRNAAHENAVRDLVARLAPDLPCFCSSTIWPIIREYERTITATISGYVQPRVAHYLDRFEQTLKRSGINAPLRITKSNGGVMGATQARSECVQMILSGTASGVIGAAYVAHASGIDKVLSLDIGGTSADVAIIVDGQPQYGVGELIGEFNIHIPSVSVTSIGHGGGSIAWVDDLGVLKVGPESAGSSPGPAAYGRGGTRPTLTDAMVVSGYLGHSALGYSAVTLDRDRAVAAFMPLAEKLEEAPETVAQSVIALSVSGMYADTSALVSRFGIDPREYRMMAFGGAGPMIACFLARELNLKGVLVPPAPGVLSALGGLIADLANDFIGTLYTDADAAGMAQLSAVYARLRAQAIGWLRKDQGHEGAYAIGCVCDMRYRGQSFEIATNIEPAWIETGDLPAITAALHEEHRRLFDHADESAAVQLISLRLTISARTPKPQLARLPQADTPAEPQGNVDCWTENGLVAFALYDREQLRAGHAFSGPAIVAQADSTTVIPADFDAEVDAFGNLLLTLITEEDRA